MASAKRSKKGKGSYAIYKSSGRREKNKVLKKERHEKRIAKFAKRREEGKTYEYKAIKDTMNPDDEREVRALKNVNHKTEFARFTSAMRKVQNELDKKSAAMKIEKKKQNRKNNKNSNNKK